MKPIEPDDPGIKILFDHSDQLIKRSSRAINSLSRSIQAAHALCNQGDQMLVHGEKQLDDMRRRTRSESDVVGDD